MKTTLKARWSTIAIAVAAATGLTTAVAQDLQQHQGKLSITEKSQVKPVGKKVHMSIAEFDAAMQSNRYLIEFEEPSAATYKGGIAGFSATSAKATGQKRLDVNAAPVKSYTDYLLQRQQTTLAKISQAVPGLKAQSHLTLTFNGVIVEYKGNDLAEKLKGVAGVKAVHKDEVVYVDMDASNDLIGAPEVWDLLGGQDAAGAGMNVAIIDTGIDFDHAMFTDNNHEPSDSPATDDYCSTNPEVCNDKIAVARFYPAPSTVHPDEFMDSPQDMNGHGSHVAGTAAGNPVSATFNGVALNFSGVAPGANLLVYKALWNTADGRGSGMTLSLADALEDAAADGADVINNSWGGGAGGSPAGSYYTPIMEALDEMGVVTVTSAGNSGPGPVTVGCPGCIEETITVASTQTGRMFLNSVEVDGLGEMAAIEGSGDFAITAPITGPVMPALEIDEANFEGCNAFAEGAFDGHIAMISRGTCSFEQKANNAEAAGAVALIVYNNAGPAAGMAMGAATLPSVMIGQEDGAAVLEAWVDGAEATINPTFSLVNDNYIDVMSDFSSRGPNGDPTILKPEIAAPGSDILSAAPDGTYATMSGTSMAGPHVAGAVALVLANNPELTPQQVKSVLMTSAKGGVKKEDAETPADAFDVGAGRLDLPASFNVGVTLDTASITSPMCVNTCSFTREVTNLSDEAAEWSVAVAFDNPNVSAEIADSISLDAGGVAALELTVDGSVAGEGWQFGTITLTDASGTYGDANIPVAIYTALSENSAALSSGVTAGELIAGSPITASLMTAMGNTGEDVTLTAQLPVDDNFVVDADSIVVTETRSTTTLSELEAETGVYTWTGTQTDLPPVVTLAAAGSFPYAGVGLDALAGVVTPQVICDTGCDEWAGELDLSSIGATWTYEGEERTALGFWENGVIEVGGVRSENTWQLHGLPGTAEPNGILAPLWSDFQVFAGDGELRFAIVGDGVDDWLIFEWYNVREWGDETGPAYTFNVWFKLNSDEVYFNYLDINQGAEPLSYGLIGLESMDGTAGSMAYATGSGYYPADGEAIVAGLERGEQASVQVDMDLEVPTFGDVAAASASGSHSRAVAVDVTDAVGTPNREFVVLLNASSGELSYDGVLPVVVEPVGALSGEVVAAPENGSVTFDGLVATYTPPAGWTGSDSFTYRVVDENGSVSAENTVTVEVTNTAPEISASVPSSVGHDEQVSLDASATTDADGDTLTYQWQLVSGPTISLANADTAVASFTAPRVDETVDATFMLTVSDGLETVQSEHSVTINKKSSSSFGWLFVLLSLPLVWLRRRAV